MLPLKSNHNNKNTNTNGTTMVYVRAVVTWLFLLQVVSSTSTPPSTKRLAFATITTNANNRRTAAKQKQHSSATIRTTPSVSSSSSRSSSRSFSLPWGNIGRGGGSSRPLPIITQSTTTTLSAEGISSTNDIALQEKNGAKKSSQPKQYKHILVILAMPENSMSRIANEAVLNTALKHTSKMSVVLRCEGCTPSLSTLRRCVSEVYSQIWDETLANDEKFDPMNIADVIIYPNNLPNVAPESWLYHVPDLDCICSHDSVCGWITESAQGRGRKFRDMVGNGLGGLDQHVDAVNNDRKDRNLPPVQALHVTNWPQAASISYPNQNVIFIDDEINDYDGSIPCDDDEDYLDYLNFENDEEEMNSLLAGASIPSRSLFESVAVGGTFDGMHYGHRKLLTLAVSSVIPVSGKLFIGVTVDAMLKSKAHAEYIPPLQERIEGVREFVYRLAPGMKNRIRIFPISDSYGPPGSKEDGKNFDALVLSHETLQTGYDLNIYREKELGFKPLTLLCTRRTEPNGMSSTTLRKLRSEKEAKLKKQN